MSALVSRYNLERLESLNATAKMGIYGVELADLLASARAYYELQDARGYLWEALDRLGAAGGENAVWAAHVRAMLKLEGRG